MFEVNNMQNGNYIILDKKAVTQRNDAYYNFTIL